VTSLEHAAILFAAGLCPSDDLPDLAAAALTEGRDSPALRELAGTPRTDVRVARDLFIAALEELSVPLPAPDDREPLAYLIAAEIADGHIDPVEGARIIWYHCWHPMGAPSSWSVFVNAVDDWDDYPEYRTECEKTICDAAAELRRQQ
jgi:hypothetical protein